MTIIGYTKVSNKFLITVPKDVRNFLKIKVGDSLVWIKENGKVYLSKT